MEHMTTAQLDHLSRELRQLDEKVKARVQPPHGQAFPADLETAQKIVDAAISQVSSLRGKIGAFQSNVINSTINSLGVALENTSAAESSIRDTDFASETAAMTRAQILSSASTNILSIANSQPQAALQLLG